MNARVNIVVSPDDDELTSLLNEYNENTRPIEGKGKGWNKFRGMVFQNLLCKYLGWHIPDDFKFAERSFVEGHPAEIDLILLKRDAKPINVTSAYRKQDVVGVFEIKASGIFYSSNVAEEKLSNSVSRIEKGVDRPFAYITRRENRTLAIATRKAMGDRAFILSEGDQKSSIKNRDEWSRLIDYLKRICRQST